MICKDCNRERPKYAKGLCSGCYDRQNRAKGACKECGGVTCRPSYSLCMTCTNKINKPHLGHKHSPESIEKIRQNTPVRRGEQHHNWQGGISKLPRVKKGYAKKHGYWGTRTYTSWYSMKQRCDCPNRPKYEHYGGRGISYDPKWSEFENFLKDMGERPFGMSLDRIDIDGNYNRENCRWSTQYEQNINRRDTSMLTYNGITKPRIEWAKEFNINHETLRKRLRVGLSVEEALTRPVKKNN